LAFKNAESDVEEFAQDGAADSEGMEFRLSSIALRAFRRSRTEPIAKSHRLLGAKRLSA